MSSARDVVAQALYEVEVSGEGWSNRTAADAVLAALRKHWASDDVTRIADSVWVAAVAANPVTPTFIRAVIAALFEEQS